MLKYVHQINGFAPPPFRTTGVYQQYDEVYIKQSRILNLLIHLKPVLS